METGVFGEGDVLVAITAEEAICSKVVEQAGENTRHGANAKKLENPHEIEDGFRNRSGAKDVAEKGVDGGDRNTKKDLANDEGWKGKWVGFRTGITISSVEMLG